MSNYNLSVGINLDNRTIFFDIPSGTTISETKYIAKTDNADNYIIEENGQGYYHYLNTEGQEVFGVFYDNSTNLESIKLPASFGTIIEVDTTAVLYPYIKRASHEKVYVISEDFTKKESMGKDDIEAEVEEQVKGYGVPKDSVMGFDGNETPEGYEEVGEFPSLGTILYESENGSNTNITLSDSIDDYEYIEIFAHRTTNNFSTKVKYTSGNLVLLSYSRIITGTFYFYTLDVSMTGTTLTRGTEGIMYIANNAPVINTGTNDIYIDKIIGYK